MTRRESEAVGASGLRALRRLFRPRVDWRYCQRRPGSRRDASQVQRSQTGGLKDRKALPFIPFRTVRRELTKSLPNRLSLNLAGSRFLWFGGTLVLINHLLHAFGRVLMTIFVVRLEGLH